MNSASLAGGSGGVWLRVRIWKSAVFSFSTTVRPTRPPDAIKALRAAAQVFAASARRSEEHTSELQSRQYLVCRLLLEKKKKNKIERIEKHTEVRDNTKQTDCRV